MIRTSPWDEIDATLLTIAKTGPTLAELVELSGLVAGVVKDLVHAYVQAGWLVQAPFSLTYELTLDGHGKLAELRPTAVSTLAKAA